MPAPKDPEARALWISRSRAARLGKKRGPHSPEHRAKIGAANKGKKRSAETKRRLRESHLGHVVSEETKDKLRKLVGERSNNWQGENIGYHAAHKRARRLWAFTPCIGCGQSEGRIGMALRDDATIKTDERGRSFSANPKDYVPLCSPCHNAYDRARRPAYLEVRDRVKSIIAGLEVQDRIVRVKAEDNTP